MNSPYKFVPQARLLEFMRQAGDPDLINLAAGLPSVDCVPKAALKRAFDAAFSEEPDVALGYHTPDGDYRLREKIAARFAGRGISVTPDGTSTWMDDISTSSRRHGRPLPGPFPRPRMNRPARFSGGMIGACAPGSQRG